METSTEEKIKAAFAILPTSVQNAILKSDWRNRIAEISKKYSLHIDQAAELETEIFLILLGLEDRDKFIGNIQTNVEVSRIVAEQIAGEANERIFKPILKAIENTPEQKTARFEKIKTKQTEESILPPTSSQTETIEAAKEEPVTTPSVESALLSHNVPPSDIPVQENTAPISEHHEAKVAPPPANLPGEEETAENQETRPMDQEKQPEVSLQKNLVTETISSQTPTSTEPSLQSAIADIMPERIVIEKAEPETVPVPVTERPIEPTPTMQTAPANTPITIAAQKLQSVVTSQNQKETVGPPPAAYGLGQDPYREPIE